MMKKLLLMTTAIAMLVTQAYGNSVSVTEEKDAHTTKAQSRSDRLDKEENPKAGIQSSVKQDETVKWQVLASGGRTCVVGDFILGCTIGQTVAGAAGLGSYFVNAGFWQNFRSESCCQGRVGDVNIPYGDEPSIGDVSLLIDAKFISLDPDLIQCYEEADINQSGGLYPTWDDVTIGDIAILIDYLFITGPSLGLADCL